jgi:hypothetical protein
VDAVISFKRSCKYFWTTHREASDSCRFTNYANYTFDRTGTRSIDCNFGDSGLSGRDTFNRIGETFRDGTNQS